MFSILVLGCPRVGAQLSTRQGWLSLEKGSAELWPAEPRSPGDCRDPDCGGHGQPRHLGVQEVEHQVLSP